METSSAERVLTADRAYARIREILVEEFGREEADIRRESSFRGSLDFDSLEVAELVLELENAFGIEIPDDDLPQLLTVQNAVDYALVHPRS